MRLCVYVTDCTSTCAYQYTRKWSCWSLYGVCTAYQRRYRTPTSRILISEAYPPDTLSPVNTLLRAIHERYCTALHCTSPRLPRTPSSMQSTRLASATLHVNIVLIPIEPPSVPSILRVSHERKPVAAPVTSHLLVSLSAYFPMLPVAENRISLTTSACESFASFVMIGEKSAGRFFQKTPHAGVTPIAAYCTIAKRKAWSNYAGKKDPDPYTCMHAGS
jgi:hypothetical protein